MIAYGFKAQFAPDVARGRKRITLRRPRSAPARHANVGEEIGLWTALRTKQARQLGVGIVTLRAALTVSASGLGRVQGDFAGVPADHIELLESLLAGDADRLARLDGFKSWRLAWSWHDANRPDEEIDLTALPRELIGWRLKRPAAAAAMERVRPAAQITMRMAA